VVKQKTMKKSQLRNIIRESIKELMTEQTGPGVYHRYQGLWSNCVGGGIVNFFIAGPSPGMPVTLGTGTTQMSGGPGNTPQNNEIFYQQVGSPSVGQVIGNFQPPSWFAGGNRCFKYLGTSLNPQSTSYNVTSWDQTQWHGPHTDCPTCYGNTPQPSSGCDQSAWSNYTNWSTNWINLGPFNSPNPNQPCNFICNKIQDFTNNLTGAGPVQTNVLNCKLEVAQQQEQTHNCNC